MVELVAVKKDYEQYVSVAKTKAEAIIEAAQKEAAKILSIAESEGHSAIPLVDKREFDFREKKLAVEARLASTVPLVISGKNGDDLIRQSFLQTINAKQR